jgi:aminopeptidase N
LAMLRERVATSRASETVQQHEAWLQEMKHRAATSRTSETVQQSEAWLQEMRHKAIRSRTAQNVSLALEGFHYDPYKDYLQHPNITIRSMEMVCTHCQAKKFKSEFPSICCKTGKVKLEPPILVSLLA